ncbi:MAG: thiamine phosphate synthase [Candidatus Omnitrophica bacterium]|nr:thiamine phosphate synthase [Candidatus Omnitrophota bacterium]
MISKRKLLKKSRLYLIIGKDIRAVRKCLKYGADLVQLRMKKESDSFFLNKALELKKIVQQYDKLLIINDRPDIAFLSGADGVHLGQNDLSIGETRRLLGKKYIIGKSTHNIKEAKDAFKEGADYIGIGPAFLTATKPRLKPVGLKIIEEIINMTPVPYFVIGGINPQNISRLSAIKAKRIAVFSFIIESADPAGQTNKLIEKLDSQC